MIPAVEAYKWRDDPLLASNFIAPYNERFDNFSQNVLGGVDLNDGSQGRMVKIWNISYDRLNSLVSIKPEDGNVALTMTIYDIRSLSLSFDNNMSPVVAYKKDDGCYIYYFNTLTNLFVTRAFPGVTECRTFVDDSRDFYNTNSDVFFVYTLNNKLYYRQQRDRYDIEYFIGDTNRILRRAGPSVEYRVQIELI